MTYAVVTFLAVALLCSLYAQVSQPSAVLVERDKTQAAESTVVALRTQITVVRMVQSSRTPTPIGRNP